MEASKARSGKVTNAHTLQPAIPLLEMYSINPPARTQSVRVLDFSMAYDND